jgi:hypothetical protein
MSSTHRQNMNVAQLRRSGVVLHPREVVALVHALCDQELAVPTPEELWITEAGNVIVGDDSPRATNVAAFLRAVGVLIDTLLPPFTEVRRYVPAASLHRLPARLGGTAESPIVSMPELLYVIQPYETDVPSRVLQHLVTRVTVVAPHQHASAECSSDEVDTERPAFDIVDFEGADDSLDEYPLEQITRSSTADAPAADGGIVQNVPEGAGPAEVTSRSFSWLVRWVRIRLAGPVIQFPSGHGDNENGSRRSLPDGGPGPFTA